MPPWLQRTLFLYEAPEDGGGGDPAPEPEAVEQSTPDADAPAPSDWTLSQDEWQATVNYLQSAAPVIQQVAAMMQNGGFPQQQQAPQEAQLPEFDPFDPDSVQEYINSAVQNGIQQGIGPYTQMFNQMAESEGERLARSTMEQLDTEVGSFDHDAAYMIAAGALGDETLNPNIVLRNAARYMHEFEERVRADERDKYKAELEGLRSAPTDSPVGSAAAQEANTVPTGPRRYHEAVERALARRTPTMPVG